MIAKVLAVEVHDLHVTYSTYEDKVFSWREMLHQRRFRRRRRDIRALKGVSFEMYRGESVGVIGTNGSGKSTLMRALTGLLPPTSGEILVRSRPTLLGVGATIRPALSGRRNIMIGCLALGMRQTEVRERLESIIDFSGLGQSIDLPMKSYSSGMRARLTFSIATAVRPEILLVDEGLAVGDRAFRRRSQERMDEIRDGAGTVVLVSHALQEIRRTDRVLWLEQGLLRAEGDPDGVVDEYQAYVDD